MLENMILLIMTLANSKTSVEPLLIIKLANSKTENLFLQPQHLQRHRRPPLASFFCLSVESRPLNKADLSSSSSLSTSSSHHHHFEDPPLCKRTIETAMFTQVVLTADCLKGQGALSVQIFTRKSGRSVCLLLRLSEKAKSLKTLKSADQHQA